MTEYVNQKNESNAKVDLNVKENNKGKRSKLSILAIMSLIISLIAVISLGYFLHIYIKDPGLDYFLPHERKIYDYWWDFFVLRFAPASIFLSIFTVLGILLSRSRRGLKLAIASFAISTFGYALFGYLCFINGHWNA